MKHKLSVYWGGWLSLFGCAAMFISLGLGAYMAHWQEYFWVGIVAIWSCNWMAATSTGRKYERLWQIERQRNRSMWS